MTPSDRTCCSRSVRIGQTMYQRGLCISCTYKMRQPRKAHTLESALVASTNGAGTNLVGAMRLAAWALRREAPYAMDLRYEQGPAACVALLAGAAGSR